MAAFTLDLVLKQGYGQDEFLNLPKHSLVVRLSCCHGVAAESLREFLEIMPSKKGNSMPWLRVLLVLLTLLMSGCGYNSLQSGDEQINAAWSDVLNQYQRRADLVPNLVNVVKGYATHEQEVFTQVAAARARVGTIQATPDLLKNEQAFTQFQQAQGELSSALSRLLAVSENYPQLKADSLFRDLQAQLEGTENRIAVARNRYIKAVQDYNVTVRSFPSNLTAKMFGYKIKPNFTVENAAALSAPPRVDFGTAPQGARP